jgi:hypothetical protein
MSQTQTPWEETHDEYSARLKAAQKEGAGWLGTVVGVAICVFVLTYIVNFGWTTTW